MINKIHHISDIHIRLLKRHSEYTQVFNTIYKQIKQNAEDSLIILTGDIVHSKTEISPELIDVVSKFFVNLAKIAKVVIIPGNHDCNLNNSSRLDTLSPIIANIKNKNIIYSKNTETLEIDNIRITHLSVFSEKADYPSLVKMDDKTNIALYHGVVTGADFGGFKAKNGEMSCSEFDGYDMVLLGDIHGHQRLQEYNALLHKPEIWYAGAIVQNNYGEHLPKGYLLWDIPTRTPQFISIPNDYGYFTIELTAGQYTVPPLMSKKPRIRLKVSDTVATDLQRIQTDLRKQYDVQEIIISNVDRATTRVQATNRQNTLDVRNVETQNNLIRSYLDTRYGNIEPEIMDKIYSINRDTNKNLMANETSRNIVWKPKRFEFSNMFAYGEDNVVDFAKLGGIIGLFAPNASGKSSLIDALMFCIFDKSSRAFKGASVLNSRKLTFNCKFNFEINDVDYYIERKGYKQRNGAVKVDVDFWTIGDDDNIISLNGDSRDETNSLIRGYVGTYEDFVTTAMSFQGNNDSFINKSQTERKDFLAKFLDIDIFDILYDEANEKTKEINTLLTEYRKQDFSRKLSTLETEVEEHSERIDKYTIEKDKLDALDRKLNEQIITETGNRIQSVDDSIDIAELQVKYTQCEIQLHKLLPELEVLKQKIVQQKACAVELYGEVKSLKDNGVEELYSEFQTCVSKYVRVYATYEKEKIKLEQKKKTLADLEQHKYDPNCSFCMDNIFVKNAIKTKKEIVEDLKQFAELEQELVDIAHVRDTIASSEKAHSDLLRKTREMDEQKLLVFKNEAAKSAMEQKIEFLKLEVNFIDSQMNAYEQNKQIIEMNRLIDKKITEIRKQLDVVLSNKKDTERDLREAISKAEVSKNEMNKIHELMKNARDIEEKFRAYELYAQAISRDGVPYELIANTIPTLQEEVNDILSSLVDFNIIFNLDGKNINAVIAYDDSRFWPIELVSGMEKFIASLAIRSALLNISNLSRPTFLAIDEGFGVMDSDNMNSLGYLFDYLRQKFDFVLIVSHLDSIKDSVDSNLEIVKNSEEFSSITFL